jgi:two-component system sensor histidine kinase HydH
MNRLLGIRVQTVVVVLLFLGSLAVLLYNTLTTLALPQRELDTRTQLRAASAELTKEAVLVKDLVGEKPSQNQDEVNEKLRVIANKVLENYPGVEGGFFIALDGRFSGYAYPTGKHAPADLARNEPPPLEAPIIRKQAQESLDTGKFTIRTADVESSRVVIATEPVGDQWPADLATWLMVRLTGPELLEKQLRHSEISSYLSLGGVAVALLLTWNLGQTLRRQRREQDRLRDELRHAEHLAGLGKLLAGVAHEVRNPLAAIRSTVQLWQRLPEIARNRDSLDGVLRAVDRLSAIVSRLLYFARSDNAERRPLDLNQLLSETLELAQAQAADQGVRFERVFAANLPAVTGSANAMRQVFLNLIGNALQAMPREGCLTCTTAYRAESSQVEILISDTGAGVSDEDHRHLFEPFFTTRPEGTGLGLALCREIVGKHQGTIEYLKTVGSGATFRIVLTKGEG